MYHTPFVGLCNRQLIIKMNQNSYFVSSITRDAYFVTQLQPHTYGIALSMRYYAQKVNKQV